MNHQSLSSFIWSVADLRRGDYKQSEYGRVILPFTVLRRPDRVLADTKAAALTELAEKRQAGLNPAPFLLRLTGRDFYNAAPLDMKRLIGGLGSHRRQPGRLGPGLLAGCAKHL
jgi:type I restriction enzyme M protein